MGDTVMVAMRTMTTSAARTLRAPRLIRGSMAASVIRREAKVDAMNATLQDLKALVNRRALERP